ncbi:MAG: multidrug transporter MdfA [Legionella sp.]|nr:MAG: multidrug transporter MdfA [Legionella sp.]
MMQPLINITRKQALLFASFFVLYEFLTYIANDMIMPGMLAVVHTFRAEESNVATSLTAYVLGGASLQLFLGPLSDRFGRRPVMLVGTALFALATLLLPWAQTIEQFLWGRFFEGMGLCYINVVGYAILQEIFSEQDAIRLIAVMANVAILAPLLGPLAGSILLQYGSWHVMFYLVGALSIVAFWGLWRFMPESVGQQKRDGRMIKRTAISIPAVLSNYATLLKHRVFLFGTLAYGLMGVMCVVWIALAPVMLVSGAKMSLVAYGVWQIPVFGAFILGNIILSYLSYRYSVRQLSLIGSAIVCSGLGLMWVLPEIFGVKPFWLMPGLIAYCLGYGLAITALNRFILFVTQVSTGTTSALISMVSMCFQAGGIEVANHLYVHGNNLAIARYAGWIGVLYMIFVLLSTLYHHYYHEKALGVENL